MRKDRKAWVAPELIVLMRNRPEEAVLALCKYKLLPYSAPLKEDMGCQRKPYEKCLFCDLTAPS